MVSRRKRRREKPLPVTLSEHCPCGRADGYRLCCGAFHLELREPATAEDLMRSRYCAFAVGNADYLLRTWHPDHRPDGIDTDDGKQWTGLEILETDGGTALHTTGTVTFRARYRFRGRDFAIEEKSNFARLGGAWVYVDAEYAR